MVKAKRMNAPWPLVVHARLYIARRPRLKRVASYMLERFPGLGRGLRLNAQVPPFITSSALHHHAFDLAHPTRSAQQIHAELKSAIERHQHRET